MFVFFHCYGLVSGGGGASSLTRFSNKQQSYAPFDYGHILHCNALFCSYRVELSREEYGAFSCTRFCGRRVIYDQERGGWAQPSRRRRRRCRLCSSSQGATSLHCTSLHRILRSELKMPLCFYCSRIRARV